MSLLGIDLGTSGIRVVCVDEAGVVLVSVATATTLHRPSADRVELDAEAVLTAVEAAIAKAVASPSVLSDPVSAVSFSVLGEAVVPVDGAGHALAGAAVSMDRRGTRAAALLDDRCGRAHVQRVTGQPLHPMFSVYKIAAGGDGWSGPAVAGYRCVDGFVAGRLGARNAIDWSMAARTGAFDVSTRSWSADILDAVRTDGGPHGGVLDQSLLPDPVAPGTVIGGVSAAAAERTGLAPGTPIVAGLHDQAASFIGAGGRLDGSAVFALGSSDCLTVSSPARPDVADTGFASYPIAPDTWITLAGTAAGGWALEWFARLLGDEVGEVFADPADEPPALLVLPYLVGSGTLDNDADARGVIAGLTLTTSRGELTRGFLEATGFELAKIVRAITAAGVPVRSINAVGGGAANRTALDIRANAAGVPLRSVPGHVSARGAALLAGLGTGVYSSLDALPPPELGETSSPEPAFVDWYDGQRSAYRELYGATRAVDRQFTTHSTVLPPPRTAADPPTPTRSPTEENMS